jgi:hypothetical protein
MKEYTISYWNSDTKALGGCGRIRLTVEAESMERALSIAKRFTLNPASYSWLAECKR